MIKLLQKNPDERLSSAEILEHPWFVSRAVPQNIDSEITEIKNSTFGLDHDFLINSDDDDLCHKERSNSQTISDKSTDYTKQCAESNRAHEIGPKFCNHLNMEIKQQGKTEPKRFV